MDNEPLNQTQFGNEDDRSEGGPGVPKASETFAKFGAPSQRKETHTVSVRDAAKMFEAAGVPRTERSISNWCWPNRQGLARLDSYFDPNDRKYFITQQSIDLAIKEELSKGQQKASVPLRKGEETVPKSSETPKTSSEGQPSASSKADEELRKENLDLKITNRAKDMHIERLYKDREAFEVERKGYIDQLVSGSRRIGELETRLLQLEGPKEVSPQSGDFVPPAESPVG